MRCGVLKVVFGVSFPTYCLKVVNYKNITKLVLCFCLSDSTYFPCQKNLHKLRVSMRHVVSAFMSHVFYVILFALCGYFTNVCLLLIIKNSSSMSLQPWWLIFIEFSKTEELIYKAKTPLLNQMPSMSNPLSGFHYRCLHLHTWRKFLADRLGMMKTDPGIQALYWYCS